MNTPMKPRGGILAGAGVLSAAACLYFWLSEIRVAYENAAGLVPHKHAGVFVGAFALPFASLLFGWISLECLRRAGVLPARHPEEKQ